MSWKMRLGKVLISKGAGTSWVGEEEILRANFKRTRERRAKSKVVCS